MTTYTASNGVTVAQARVAKYIRTHKIWNPEKEVRAKEFWTETGAKMPKAEIISIVQTEIARQKEIQNLRYESRKITTPWHKNRILHMQARRDTARQNWQQQYDNAIELRYGLAQPYTATYYDNDTYIKLGSNMLRITWTTETDWEYYPKSYRKPKNSYSNRRIELLKKDVTELIGFSVVNTYNVDKFIGQFIIYAIAKFFNLRPVQLVKHLRKVQLNEYFTITLIHRFGSVEVYERAIAGVPVDCCVLFHGLTYHAGTVRGAFRGLRRKLEAKIERETECIDYSYARKLGFCNSGIQQFVNDNNLNIDSKYTRTELRNIVIKNRKENAQKYSAELRKIGIIVSSLIC